MYMHAHTHANTHMYMHAHARTQTHSHAYTQTIPQKSQDKVPRYEAHLDCSPKVMGFYV